MKSINQLMQYGSLGTGSRNPISPSVLFYFWTVSHELHTSMCTQNPLLPRSNLYTVLLRVKFCSGKIQCSECDYFWVWNWEGVLFYLKASLAISVKEREQSQVKLPKSSCAFWAHSRNILWKRMRLYYPRRTYSPNQHLQQQMREAARKRGAKKTCHPFTGCLHSHGSTTAKTDSLPTEVANLQGNKAQNSEQRHGNCCGMCSSCWSTGRQS